MWKDNSERWNQVAKKTIVRFLVAAFHRRRQGICSAGWYLDVTLMVVLMVVCCCVQEWSLSLLCFIQEDSCQCVNVSQVERVRRRPEKKKEI